MRNAKQLLQEYNDFSFRDPQAAAEMFTDDGAFEMPYFESLGVAGRYQGHDQIRGFSLSGANSFLICNSLTQQLSVNPRMGRWLSRSTSSRAVRPKPAG